MTLPHVKSLWSHTHTWPFKIHCRFRSWGFASRFRAPQTSTLEPPAWSPPESSRRRANTGTLSASWWCHCRVSTQGCGTGALIWMLTSCKTHTCKENNLQRRSNVLISWEINALGMPWVHIREIFRAHLSYGSGSITCLFFFFKPKSDLEQFKNVIMYFGYYVRALLIIIK